MPHDLGDRVPVPHRCSVPARYLPLGRKLGWARAAAALAQEARRRGNGIASLRVAALLHSSHGVTHSISTKRVASPVTVRSPQHMACLHPPAPSTGHQRHGRRSQRPVGAPRRSVRGQPRSGRRLCQWLYRWPVGENAGGYPAPIIQGAATSPFRPAVWRAVARRERPWFCCSWKALIRAWPGCCWALVLSCRVLHHGGTGLESSAKPNAAAPAQEARHRAATRGPGAPAGRASGGGCPHAPTPAVGVFVVTLAMVAGPQAAG